MAHSDFPKTLTSTLTPSTQNQKETNKTETKDLEDASNKLATS